MRYVSLFSGIEAASVAWGPLGWEPVAFSEIEPFPCAVLKERFPEVPNLGDVTKIDWSLYVGSVDVVVGGSPCQSFSVAGNREGLAGESGLMWEYIRAVSELMPRYFVWENVPGALSSEGGKAFAQLLAEMDDVGYGMAWRVLDAQYFGVAQRRRRVFLVGCLGSAERAAAVLFERESLRWDSPSSREKREELADAARRGARCGSGAGSPSWAVDGNVCDREARQNGSGISDGVSPTLDTVDRHAVAYAEDGCLNPWDPQSKRVFGTGGAYQTLYAHGSGGHDDGAVLAFDDHESTIAFKYHQGAKAGSVGACEDGTTPTLTADFHQRAICFNAGNVNDVASIGDGQVELAPTLRSSASGTNQVPTVVTQYGGEVAGTLTARADGSPCADRGQNVVCSMTGATGSGSLPRRVWRWPWIVRRLMPVECERLQGFPDDWTLVPYRGKPAEECPDTPRYKAIGNSMAVPVMQWIGERIAMVDEMEDGL